MNVAQETLGFRRAGLSPALSLLMSAFALLIAPASLSRHLHSHRERSSTTPAARLIALPVAAQGLTRRGLARDIKAANRPNEVTGRHRLSRHDARTFSNDWTARTRSGGPLRSAASVIGLSPVTSSAQDDSISELLRFL